MSKQMNLCFSLAAIISCLSVTSLNAQTARDIRGAAAVEPLENEPPARIVIDPPLPDPLKHGRVVIQYRTQNLHMAPIFGPAALAVSPRVGHIHVSVDDATWVWVDASGEPVILNGLPPGPHSVRIQLENANHQTLDQGAVKFTIPQLQITKIARDATPLQPLQNEPSAKIIIDSPRAEPLSRGVVFFRLSHGKSPDPASVWPRRSPGIAADWPHPRNGR